ncbi:MAG TPA: hypothetical protein DCS05_02520 [Nitrospiraceae bacterium]|nr:hypothetical protein [Nitrospiraceae bacterium]
MLCPVCQQEGQAITCIAGTQESRIVYHPEKRIHPFCTILEQGNHVAVNHVPSDRDSVHNAALKENI